MVINISTSGGLLGTGLPGKEKTIDTQTLSEPLKEEVCRRFDPKALAKLSKERGHPGSADRLVYHVTVSDSDGGKHRFDIVEAALPAEMIDLIDEF